MRTLPIATSRPVISGMIASNGVGLSADPTSVALGGPDLTTLFGTTSRHHLADPASEPWAGAVLALETEVAGQPVHRFG